MHFRYLFLLLLWTSCTDPQPNPPSVPTETTPAPTPPTLQPIQARKAAPKQAPNCPADGDLLEDVSIWLSQKDRLIRFVADKSTLDIDFGPSYRILLIQQGSDCSTIIRKTLPVNYSPDYPYYLDTISFLGNKPLLCALGFDVLYCYDPDTDQLLPALQPTYDERIMGTDGQSGAPLGLVSEGNYLIGFGADMGGYVFNLEDLQQPEAILPMHYYFSDDGYPRSLFQIKDSEGRYRLCIPTLQEEGLTIQMNDRRSTRPFEFIKASRDKKMVTLIADGEQVRVDLLGF